MWTQNWSKCNNCILSRECGMKDAGHFIILLKYLLLEIPYINCETHTKSANIECFQMCLDCICVEIDDCFTFAYM